MHLIPSGSMGPYGSIYRDFLLQPRCAAGLFPVLVLLEVGIFPCHPVYRWRNMLGVECTFSGNQRGLPDAVLLCGRGCKMKPFVFYFEGKSKSILWIIRHLETYLKWKILEIHRIYLPPFLAIYLATTSSIAVNSCLYCSGNVMKSM